MADESTIKIQDEQEKKQYCEIHQERTGEKIRIKEIIEARQIINGQARVYYAEETTKKNHGETE